MDSFTEKEFFIAGLLQYGTPFSLYLTKLLIALLLGGCNSWPAISVTAAIILMAIAVKFGRRR